MDNSEPIGSKAIFQIREMNRDDLTEVAVLHQNSYPRDHFTSRFSIKMNMRFYEELISVNRFCYVAVDCQNKLAGLIIGGDQTASAVKRFIKKNWVQLSMVFFWNPSFIIEKLPAIKSMFAKNDNPLPDISTRCLNIMVHPDYHGKGVANRLLDHFESGLKNAGIFIYALSVRKNNAKAINFYRKTLFNEEAETQVSIIFTKCLLD